MCDVRCVLCNCDDIQQREHILLTTRCVLCNYDMCCVVYDCDVVLYVNETLQARRMSLTEFVLFVVCE